MAGNIQRTNPDTGLPAARSHPLMTLRDEVDRLFESFFPTAHGMFDVDPFRRVGAAFRAMGDIAPGVDVKETDDRFEISAELPGMDEKDVNVSIRDGVLAISGEKKAERKEEKADYHLSERSYGSFTRAFRLPETADEEHVSAEFAKGVLTVTVPKRAGTKKEEKKIEVKTH
ncbi:MAG: Hsp20/alpha crystallin family protein [Pseudomonadota bacterium]